MLEGSCHCGSVYWHMDTDPESVTACNCTICRRYGVLWAYGWFNDDTHIFGTTKAYRRADLDSGEMDFRFCLECGCVVAWVGIHPYRRGRLRAAVNLRLAEPDSVLHLPIRRFDGLHAFNDLPPSGRTVRDMWF